MIKMAAWVCPYCNKMCLDYWDLELENESFFYPRECTNCWAEGLEWYTFEYDCQELTEEWHLHPNQKEKWQ